MRLKKIISSITPEHIQIGEYQVIMVSHQRSIAQLYNRRVDAFIVDNDEVLKAILSDDELYLKPVFYNGHTFRQCDGEYDSLSSNIISQKIDVLKNSIKKYENLPLPSGNEKRLLVKILRYLLSRKLMLKPLNNRLSKIGYSYPIVEDMSIESDSLHIIKNLNVIANENYFTRTPIDKVNICYDCQSSYLNFSECCSKCNALDLKTEELVHHFRCAYVGPQSDFMKDEKMICPKCDHQLKHIGIDYDKPSEIHTCRSCNHSSQETKMKAKCVDCAKENELDQLVTYDIYEYSPTEKARSLAIQAHQKESFITKHEEKNTSLINYGAFNLIKSHESKRSQRFSIHTYEAIISIDQSILIHLNQGMRNALVEELASIIKPYLKENDLLALDTERNIHALLIDYEDHQSKAINETLDYNLNKMLIDNGWSTRETVAISSQKVNL